MEATFKLLDGIETLLVGDFNFDNSKTSETNIYSKAGYEDQLTLAGIPDTGPGSFTKFKTPKQKASRPDKILYNGQQMQLMAAQIGGKFSTPFYKDEKCEMVEKDGLVRTPSDHLCVLADFKFKWYALDP